MSRVDICIFDVSSYNMINAKQTQKRRYRSNLREAQAGLTRNRILAAASRILEIDGGTGSLTFKRVAEAAGTTEMTVYRHFPSRNQLLNALWEHLNQAMAPGLGMPTSLSELKGQHAALFAGFDKVPAQIAASITTPEGRAMRASLNAERERAFLGIAAELTPAAGQARQRHLAGVIQLLHSAYAWDSLREQWGMDGAEAGEATLWAIEALTRHAKDQTS